MVRKGLIICNPGEVGADNYCEGVYKDETNYKRFLQRPHGGVWYEKEIRIMERPRRYEVQNAIGELRYCDYALVVFSGHGCYSSRTQSTWLELRDGEEIDSNELRQGSAKQTVILDCCRVIARELPAIVEKAAEFRAAVSADDMVRSRFYYDNAIAKSPNGLVVLHACDINETAGDDSKRGGYYSCNLIENAEAWARSTTIQATLSVVAVHQSAATAAQRQSGNRQNPQIEKPRSGPYFPFSIVA